MVAQSYFGELLQHGVKIYTYTPGLLHAKSVVADGEMGFVGSVNMDYRSFQLHFECGTLFTGSAVAAVQEDMDDILEKSRRVTLAALAKAQVVCENSGCCAASLCHVDVKGERKNVDP